MAGFCPIYSFALFSPTIVKNMGYAANEAQLMSVPPYVCACAFTIGASWFADRFRRRGVLLLGFQLVAILGFALLAASGDPAVQYTGLVFAAIGRATWCLKWVSPTNAEYRHISSDTPWACVERQQYRR